MHLPWWSSIPTYLKHDVSGMSVCLSQPWNSLPAMPSDCILHVGAFFEGLGGRCWLEDRMSKTNPYHT